MSLTTFVVTSPPSSPLVLSLGSSGLVSLCDVVCVPCIYEFREGGASDMNAQRNTESEETKIK